VLEGFNLGLKAGLHTSSIALNRIVSGKMSRIFYLSRPTSSSTKNHRAL
jgi:hypothetical protein